VSRAQGGAKYPTVYRQPLYPRNDPAQNENSIDLRRLFKRTRIRSNSENRVPSGRDKRQKPVGRLPLKRRLLGEGTLILGIF
jgi:hypothetical protein